MLILIVLLEVEVLVIVEVVVKVQRVELVVSEEIVEVNVEELGEVLRADEVLVRVEVVSIDVVLVVVRSCSTRSS